MVSAFTLNFFVLLAVIVLIFVPAAILRNTAITESVNRKPVRVVTVISLVFWFAVSLVVAAVWFLIVIAAHSVKPEYKAIWMGTNVAYLLLGIATIVVHRNLVARW